jgi:hypothetical protein
MSFTLRNLKRDLDDEVFDLKEYDAVRVPPGAWRGYEAGPDGLEILVIGAPSLGDSPRDDVTAARAGGGAATVAVCAEGVRRRGGERGRGRAAGGTSGRGCARG